MDAFDFVYISKNILMKNLILLTFLFCTSSLLAQQSQGTETIIIDEAQIMGTWWVDTTYFIDDGVQDEGSTPILPTSWTFSEDGSMLIENSSRMFATYELAEGHILIDMLGTIMDHTILELTNNSLRLTNTVYEFDSGSLRAISILRRRE